MTPTEWCFIAGMLVGMPIGVAIFIAVIDKR